MEGRLDAIKRDGIVDDDSSVCPTAAPLYLADELEIVGDLIKRAARKLRSRGLRRIVITGDRGASCLAALSAQKAGAETRGGATLEEILVSVVELTLDEPSRPRVEVELSTLEVCYAFSKAPTLEFFAKQPLSGDAFVTVETAGALKRYPARTDDGQHFSAVLTDVKKKGVYRARFALESDVLGPFEFKAVPGGIKKNFDDDF